MRRESGAVLINALVLVLVISAIAAALLTRAEGARVRAESTRDSAQMALYLDGIEALVPVLLREPVETGTVSLGQSWARGGFEYQIGRGHVTAQLRDLQGGLNVNWLVQPDDYAREAFARLFAELGVPVSLVDAIADYLRPGGPARNAAYEARTPPLRPRGGAIEVLALLREVEGMTPGYFRALEPHVAALPAAARLNLNTASPPVLRAALAPFPAELVAETLARGADDPLNGLGNFRRRLFEILETEDVEDYPLDRLGAGSDWFAARLTARLDDRTRVRRAVFHRDVTPEPALRLAYRWSEPD